MNLINIKKKKIQINFNKLTKLFIKKISLTLKWFIITLLILFINTRHSSDMLNI